MRPSSFHRAAAFVLVVAGVLASRVSANCGAEGCPLTPQGPESVPGRFSFDFGYQSIEQNRLWDGSHQISEAEALAAEGGTGHVVEQLTRTRSFLVNARARLTDRIQLTASWPYMDRVHRHSLQHHVGLMIPSEWHMRGAGDATLMGHWTALTSPRAGAVTFQLGVKLPTGERDAEEIDGEKPEPAARLSTGSTDASLGVLYRKGLGMRAANGDHLMVPLSASVSARVNGRGTDRYRMGNEWQAGVASGYPITRQIQLLGQINATVHARDDVGDTDAEAHSIGGTAVFAAPGLRAEVLPGMSAFSYYQFRLYQHTNGPQLVAPYHLVFGLGYAIGH